MTCTLKLFENRKKKYKTLGGRFGENIMLKHVLFVPNRSTRPRSFVVVIVRQKRNGFFFFFRRKFYD